MNRSLPLHTAATAACTTIGSTDLVRLLPQGFPYQGCHYHTLGYHDILLKVGVKVPVTTLAPLPLVSTATAVLLPGQLPLPCGVWKQGGKGKACHQGISATNRLLLKVVTRTQR